MATIDIQITFDAETIIEKYGPNTDSTHPVGIDSTYVYMVTEQANVVSGQGGGELTIAAQTEDTIRWREAILSPDYAALLYAFVPTSPPEELISPPESLSAQVTVPVPNPQNPVVPNRQTIEDYFWNSTVLGAGTVTYHFNFMLVDRSGAIQGYYWWDPFINITS